MRQKSTTERHESTSASSPGSTLSDHYEYGERGVLTPGMIFRVRKGPYWVLEDGRRLPWTERGKFKFVGYDPRGWIIAHRVETKGPLKGVVGGFAVLHVGKTRKSKQMDGLILRGYVIRRPRSERGVGAELMAVDEGAKKGTCSKHRTYRGLRRPRVNCPECIALYEAKNPGKSAFGQEIIADLKKAKRPRGAGGGCKVVGEYSDAPDIMAAKRQGKPPAARSIPPGATAFVQKMKDDRKARKLTCQAYGALAGLSGAQISLLETGKAKLTQRTLDKLSPLVNA